MTHPSSLLGGEMITFATIIGVRDITPIFFFKLKDVIQDLINGGKVFIDGLVKYSIHKSFKQPYPDYGKGELSHANKKNHDAKINYAYANIDNVINMIELVKYLCMMSSNAENQPNCDVEDERPKVFLKMRNYQHQDQDTRPKVVL